MNLNSSEKASIARLLWGLMISDEELDPKECQVIFRELAIDIDNLLIAKDRSYSLSISSLKLMTNEQRSFFCNCMLKVLNADGVIRQSELDYIDQVLIDSELKDKLIDHSPLLMATISASRFKRQNGFC